MLGTQLLYSSSFPILENPTVGFCRQLTKISTAWKKECYPVVTLQPFSFSGHCKPLKSVLL